MDKYLQDIVRDKRYWEAKRQEIRRQEKELEELKKRYADDLNKINSNKKEVIAQAKTEAQNLIAETNAIIEKTIREIKEAQAEKEKTREIRRHLDAFKTNIIQTKPKTKSADTQPQQKKIAPKPVAAPKALFNTGDTVRMKGQQAVGTIIDCKDNFFIVAFGALKTNLKASQIEKISGAKARQEERANRTNAQIYDIMAEKKSQFKPEIDVRGMRGDEALQAVTYFIDDAIQCAAAKVRILHGTGTGALRQIIREYLNTVYGVKRFADEHVQFGGAGITVVELE